MALIGGGVELALEVDALPGSAAELVEVGGQPGGQGAAHGRPGAGSQGDARRRRRIVQGEGVSPRCPLVAVAVNRSGCRCPNRPGCKGPHCCRRSVLKKTCCRTGRSARHTGSAGRGEAVVVDPLAGRAGEGVGGRVARVGDVPVTSVPRVSAEVGLTFSIGLEAVSRRAVTLGCCRPPACSCRRPAALP